MREILFRGRTLKMDIHGRSGTLEWIIGQGITQGGNTQIWRYEEGLGNCNYTVDKSTVGQFTGLCDKNGKRIFEGDIFELDNGRQFGVKWDSNNARFLGFGVKASPDRTICCVGYSDKSGNSAVKVVGNIHDNPELLEGNL